MDIADLINKPELKDIKNNSEKLNAFLDSQMIMYTNDKLYAKIIEVFEEVDEAIRWFYTPNFYFDKKRPYDFCVNGKKEYTFDRLVAMEYGDNV